MWQGNGDEDPLASWASILESMDHYRQSVLACGAATELTEDGAGCYAYDGCDGATLCEYDGVGHEYPPSYTASAWAYLDADWDLGAADPTFEADYTCEAEAGWGDWGDEDDDEEEEAEDEFEDEAEDEAEDAAYDDDGGDLWTWQAYCARGVWPTTEDGTCAALGAATYEACCGSIALEDRRRRASVEDRRRQRRASVEDRRRQRRRLRFGYFSTCDCSCPS
jgi:hypothetical protein